MYILILQNEKQSLYINMSRAWSSDSTGIVELLYDMLIFLQNTLKKYYSLFIRAKYVLSFVSL